MKPSKFYQEYVAIKRHFISPKYDYFKFKGKTRGIDLDKYPQRAIISTLAQKIRDKDVVPFLVSNMLVNPRMWIGEMLHNDVFSVHKKKMLHAESVYRNDLKTIVEFAAEYDKKISDVVVLKDGSFPDIIKLYRQNFITLESLMILLWVLDLWSYYLIAYYDDFILGELFQMMRKYAPFLKFDLDRMKEITFNVFREGE